MAGMDDDGTGECSTGEPFPNPPSSVIPEWSNRESTLTFLAEA